MKGRDFHGMGLRLDQILLTIAGPCAHDRGRCDLILRGLVLVDGAVQMKPRRARNGQRQVLSVSE